MSISGTQADSLFIDLDNDGILDAGETLLSGGSGGGGGTGLLTIASGEAPAAPEEAPAAPGLDTPAAAAVIDAYGTAGNTLLIVGTVPGAPNAPHATFDVGVIGNDTNTTGAVISAFDAASANGGTIVMVTSGANIGSFTYLPAVGFTGTDTFTYTLSESGGATSVATVTVTVGDRVWYVDNNAPAGGDGRSTSPFNSLAAVSGAAGPDAAGDIIYVRTGTGTYTGGITLANDQTLWGENEALTVDGLTVQAAGADPTLTNAAGSGVTLAQNNTLKGFTVGNTTVADIVDGGGSVGNLVISNVNLTGTGQAIDIDQGGALNVAIDTLTSTSSTGQGVQLAGSGAALTGTFSASAGNISGAAGAAFMVGDGAGGAESGGTVAINYGGSITSSATGRAVDIQDRADGAGNITLAGNISHTNGASEGIFLDDNAAGSIVFSGAAKTINTSAGGATAISISDQTGASVLFSNGGLSINTTTGTGFNATGGGTVTVQGAGNAISSTSATALNVVDTDIGAAGLTFSSVSAGGNDTAPDPVNGIVLNNTGANGGLSIVGSAGSATLGSGGTIQNTTGAGILLVDTRGISLDEMRILNTGDSGVSGSGVTNFSFTNGAINDAGNAGSESAIAFNGEGTILGLGDNLNGTLTVTGSTFVNSFHAALDVRGDAGTITSATLTGNTITNPGSSGINFTGTGSNVGVFQIEDATISGNTITGSGGSGISIAIENLQGAGPGPDAGRVTTLATGPKPFSDPNNQISITGNTITLDTTGTNAIALTNHTASTDRGEMNFEIRNNNLSGSAAGSVVSVVTNGTADTVGVIDGNLIDANHTPNLGLKNGIEITSGPGGGGNNWNTQVTIDVTNNTIRETDSFGIAFRAGGSSGESYVTIANNNVTAPAEAAASGIFVQAGDATSGNDQVYLKIFGNTSAGNGAPGIALLKEGTDPRVNVFAIFDGPGGPKLSIPPTNADVQTFIAATNPAANGAVVVGGDRFVKFDTDGAPNHFGVFPPAADPVNVLPGAQSATENRNLQLGGISVTAAAGAPLQVTLSATNGVLSLAPGGAEGVTFTTGNGSSDATMTFTGTTAEVNAALAGLSYRSNFNFVGNDTITLTTVDLGAPDVAGSQTDSDTIAVTVADGGPVRVTNDLNADGRGDIVWRGPAPEGRVATWLVQAGNGHTKLADGPVGLNFGIVDSHGDYNGDGRADILWRSTDGTVATWLMNGDGTHGLGVRTPTAANWTLVNGHGDYNGDGKSDLLWRGPNGEVTSWLIDGATRTAVTPHGAVPLNWQILDTQGDYNGDGRNDILWRSSDGTISTWLMNGAGAHSFGLRTPTAPDWTLVDGHSDFNADGKSDLLWRGPNGEVTSWLVDGDTRTAVTPHGAVPLNWQIVDTQGDYNGDGRSDVLWRNTDGLISTWLMNGTGAHTIGVRNPMPAGWTLLDGHGDYNGDGNSDLLWRGPNGEVRSWLIDGSSITGQPTYDTVPLNWNIAEEPGVALMGDAGANVLTGTVAANLLRGLGGADTLIGNGGGDRFVFDTALDGTTNVDTVRDFRSGQDKLLLSDVIFSNLTPGPLTAANLVAGPGAQPLDADDRILYNTATGTVSYDADGNGAGAALAFATLFGAPSLVATDIIVGAA